MNTRCYRFQASTLRTALLCTVMLVAVANAAVADSYRCGRQLIRTGDTAADVLRVCGEPRYKDRGKESLRLQGATQQVSVERWHYKKSRRSLEHIVLLHRGRVVAVEVGSR
ncbi:MAG: DUF2845 domain-containing protein [Xanthomonadales bacterium]|nr:DUF2845 domain-containing protein [Xanthomonadales bacterium]